MKTADKIRAIEGLKAGMAGREETAVAYVVAGDGQEPVYPPLSNASDEELEARILVAQQVIELANELVDQARSDLCKELRIASGRGVKKCRLAEITGYHRQRIYQLLNMA